MTVINDEKDEPTWEEVLQENRDEAEDLAEADEFKEDESEGDS
jgi:hypothetical protein